MKNVNCRSDYRFQVDIKVPNTSGVLAAPTLGALTGIKLRLASTPGGTTIHANVGDLSASETSVAGRFYVTVDAALLATHVLAAVGHRGVFYAVWSQSGNLDKASVAFRAVDGELI